LTAFGESKHFERMPLVVKRPTEMALHANARFRAIAPVFFCAKHNLPQLIGTLPFYRLRTPAFMPCN
jgi:hypothetical protein